MFRNERVLRQFILNRNTTRDQGLHHNMQILVYNKVIVQVSSHLTFLITLSVELIGRIDPATKLHQLSGCTRKGDADG